MLKRYLIINWEDYKEKNNQRAGDEGQYDQQILEGMKIDLIGVNGDSFVKEVREDEIVLTIYNKGEYTIKLNESTKVTYTDGYQVCGDWVDLYTSFTIKYSDKSLKEIRDALPPFEIENNVLKKINSKEDIIKIPEGVVEIDYCAGKDLYMDEVVLPSTLKKIGEFAFANCKYLKHIDIPEGVETIESFAFHYSGLETINLSSTIKKIGTYVFSGTPFFEQYKKKEIVILGNGLLYLYKRDDAEIVVPDGVKSICPLAFSQTGDTLSNYTIKKIVLPDSVENICESAFFRLKSLKDININHKMLIHKDAFNESVYEEKFKEFLENTGK